MEWLGCLHGLITCTVCIMYCYSYNTKKLPFTEGYQANQPIWQKHKVTVGSPYTCEHSVFMHRPAATVGIRKGILFGTVNKQILQILRCQGVSLYTLPLHTSPTPPTITSIFKSLSTHFPPYDALISKVVLQAMLLGHYL